MPIRLQSGPDAAGVFRMRLGELIVEFAPVLGRSGRRKPEGSGGKPKPSPIIGHVPPPPPARRNPMRDPIVTYIVDPHAGVAQLGGGQPAIVDLDLSEMMVIGTEHVAAMCSAVAALPWSVEGGALKAQVVDAAAAEQFEAQLREIMGEAAPRLEAGVAPRGDGAAG